MQLVDSCWSHKKDICKIYQVKYRETFHIVLFYLTVAIVRPAEPAHDGRTHPGEGPGQGPEKWPIRDRLCHGEVGEARWEGPAVPGKLDRDIHDEEERSCNNGGSAQGLAWSRTGTSAVSCSSFIGPSLPSHPTVIVHCVATLPTVLSGTMVSTIHPSAAHFVSSVC